jgi:hypothetical protein
VSSLRLHNCLENADDQDSRFWNLQRPTDRLNGYEAELRPSARRCDLHCGGTRVGRDRQPWSRDLLRRAAAELELHGVPLPLRVGEYPSGEGYPLTNTAWSECRRTSGEHAPLHPSARKALPRVCAICAGSHRSARQIATSVSSSGVPRVAYVSRQRSSATIIPERSTQRSSTLRNRGQRRSERYFRRGHEACSRLTG